MARKFSSDAERKAAMANMNNGSKGTNSNDIEQNNPIPSDNGNDENKMIRKDDKTFKQVQVWKFEDADDELQEKILEKQRNNVAEFNDDFFAQDEGLIFDKILKKDGIDIGLKNLIPDIFEVGGNRGDDFIQFNELEIENMTKFAEYLDLPEELLKKVNVGFKNVSGSFGSDNTALEFSDVNGSEISLEADTGFVFDHYGDVDDDDDEDEESMFVEANVPTFNESLLMLKAFDRFADLMDSALVNLVNNYESQFEDETIKENIEANEYVFDEDGNIA